MSAGLNVNIASIAAGQLFDLSHYILLARVHGQDIVPVAPEFLCLLQAGIIHIQHYKELWICLLQSTYHAQSQRAKSQSNQTLLHPFNSVFTYNLFSGRKSTVLFANGECFMSKNKFPSIHVILNFYNEKNDMQAVSAITICKIVYLCVTKSYKQ